MRLAKAAEDGQLSLSGLFNVAIWDDFHIFHSQARLQL